VVSQALGIPARNYDDGMYGWTAAGHPVALGGGAGLELAPFEGSGE